MAIQQHYSALLLTLTLLIAAPAIAQDNVLADGGTAQDPPPADAGDGQKPTMEPVQRVFIRASGDTGALAQQYPHLAVWLEPEDEPRVLALVERETTATPSGAMVILSDEGQSANDSLLEGLRARLSEAGWAAMTLGLEQSPPSLQTARERLADAAPASEDDNGEAVDESVMIDVNEQAARDLLDAHRKTMNARLAAAVAWFLEKQYQNVVLVGVGRGADEVRVFMAEAPPAVSRVAWVAADFGGQSPARVSDALTGETTPILDLYPSRSPAAVNRQAAFRRVGLASYQAMSAPVPSRPSGRDAGVIANRLLGWLDPR